MESFFLAETTKYLYLLFDPDNFIHNNGSCGDIVHMSGGTCVLGAGGYIFNTEAHPIDIAAVYCCGRKHKDHQNLFNTFQKTMDLYSLLDIKEKTDFLSIFKNVRHKNKIKNNYNLNFDSPSSIVSSKFIIEHDNLRNESVINLRTDDAFNSENDKFLNPLDSPEADRLQTNSIYFSNTSQNNVESQNSLPIFPNTSTEYANSTSEIVPTSLMNRVQNSSHYHKSSDHSNFTLNKFELNTNEMMNDIFSNTNKKNMKEINHTSLNDIYGKEFQNYELLSCPAQPFASRFNIMGEIFDI